MNDINKLILENHPEKCPRCGNPDEVTYERFSRENGEYVCFDCGWSGDPLTGKTFPACEYCKHNDSDFCDFSDDGTCDRSEEFELDILEQRKEGE